MKYSCLLILISILNHSLASGQHNILKNSEMDEGKSEWILAKFNGASGLNSIDTTFQLSGMYSMTIHTNRRSHNEIENLQFFQIIPVSLDKSYAVYFKALVSTNCKIGLTFRNETENYWIQKVELKKGKKDYGPFYFESGATDFFTYFGFLLGELSDKIFLDSICVTEHDKLIAQKPNPGNSFVAKGLVSSRRFYPPKEVNNFWVFDQNLRSKNSSYIFSKNFPHFFNSYFLNYRKANLSVNRRLSLIHSDSLNNLPITSGNFLLNR